MPTQAERSPVSHCVLKQPRTLRQWAGVQNFKVEVEAEHQVAKQLVLCDACSGKKRSSQLSGKGPRTTNHHHQTVELQRQHRLRTICPQGIVRLLPDPVRIQLQAKARDLS